MIGYNLKLKKFKKIKLIRNRIACELNIYTDRHNKEQCVFPFVYNRTEYKRCIGEGRLNSRSWCSTDKVFTEGTSRKLNCPKHHDDLFQVATMAIGKMLGLRSNNNDCMSIMAEKFASYF